MVKERFALAYRTLARDCGIALVDSESCTRRLRFGVRRYCAAFLLLSTIGYQLSAICASAQLAPTWKPQGREPLEKYDMPPAYIYRLESSPRMVSPFGAFTSYQVNVDANGDNIVGDAANESCIAVDPTNPMRMAIGWRQFDTWQSNFRQAGYGYTSDGGLTWTFPGVLQPGFFRSDPVTTSDETGLFFYNSLRSDGSSFFCTDIWRSTDGGAAWTLISGKQGPIGGDKQWFTIDKTGGHGHGFQYQANDQASCDVGIFNRSTDAGVTWETPINIPNVPIFGTLDVDSNGNLYVGGEGAGGFWCARSSNAQFGDQTPVFDQNTAVELGGQLVGGGINPGGLDGQLFLVVDHSGTATNDYIYMLASVEPPGRSTTDVMFARSTDGGANFREPVRINDDGNPSKWHWFGTFSVAPNGRLDAVWYDNRNANNLDSQLFYSYSTDAGVTWSPNVPVSDPFNPQEGWPNQNKIGDYITIVSDETGGNVAYAATFNFNPNRGQHEQDVYYVRVFPTGGPTPTPTATPTVTPTATPTATPRPTPTPRSVPTPRVRPTPRPRP
jgi:hypothetical protein